MTKQINTLVSTQWLLPLFNEQLNELHQRWHDAYHDADSEAFVAIKSDYHRFVANLDVANLNVFRQLGVSIETFLQALVDESVSITQALIALYASELLQYELNIYTKTGDYQADLLMQRSHYLQQFLEQAGVDTSAIESIKAKQLDHNTDDKDSSQFDVTYLLDNIDIPTPNSPHSLTQAQFQSLVAAWRHSVQQLLRLNKNDPATLDRLKKIAYYLLLDATFDESKIKQALWYITGLWLDALMQNDDPTPSVYAHTLADLDIAIAHAQKNSFAAELKKALFLDVYIQLNILESIPDATTEVIKNVKAKINCDKQFLPRLLEELEVLIFSLDKPAAVIKPLQRIQNQLNRRGWYMYEQQVEQVLQDLYAVEKSPDSYDSIRWQVERQLQELYGAILNSAEVIDTQIGQGQFSTQQRVDIGYDFDNHDKSTSTSGENQDGLALNNESSTDGNSTADSDYAYPQLDMNALRNVRIAVEDIKTAFTGFLQSHALSDLPQTAVFETLEKTFAQIQLYDVVDVIEQCKRIFEDIKEYELNQLNWRLTDTIAEGLATLELFLDYLAQQTLDLKLLNEALEHFESARVLLVDLSQSPNMAEDTSPLSTSASAGVTRYDDSGEVVIQNQELQQESQEDTSQLHPAPLNVLNDSSPAVFDDETVVNIDDDSFDNLDFISRTDSQADSDDKADNERSPDSDQVISEDKANQSDSRDEGSSRDVTVSAESTEVVDSPELQEARATLKEDSFDMDEEIVEIFIEEAEEVLQTLETHLPVWQHDKEDLTALNEIRRGFHTLKGSGRMVGAYSAAELAWAVENLLNRVLDNTLSVTDELIGFISETQALIPTLVNDFSQKKPPSIDPAITVVKANNLLKGKPIEQGLAHIDGLTAAQDATDDASTKAEEITPVDADATTNDIDEIDHSDNQKTERDSVIESADLNSSEPSLSDESISHDAKFDDSNDSDSNNDNNNNNNNDTAIDTVDELAESTVNDVDSISHTQGSSQLDMPAVLTDIIDEVNLPDDDQEADADIKEIFIEEAGEVLDEIVPIFRKWRIETSDESLLTEIRRGFHTLKGSGRMVGAFYTGELAWAIENLLNRILDNTVTITPDMVSLFDDVLQAYPQLVEIFEEGSLDYPSSVVLWAACANAYSKGLADQFDYEDIKTKWLAASTQTEEVPDDPAEQQPSEQEGDDDTVSASHDKALEQIQTANVKLAGVEEPTRTVNEEDLMYCEIFLEEAEELVEKVKKFIASNELLDEIAIDDEVVRAFHTMRGATGSESLKEVGEVSAAVEHSLRLLQQQEEPMNRSHLQVLEQSVALIEQYIDQFKRGGHGGLSAEDNDSTTASGEQYISQEEQQKVTEVKRMLEASMSAQHLDQEAFNIAKIIDHDIEDLLDAQWQAEKYFNQDSTDLINYAELIKTQIENLSRRVADSTTFMRLLTSLHGVYTKLAQQPNIGLEATGNKTDSDNDKYNHVLSSLIAGHDALTQLFDALAGSMSLHLDDEIISDLTAIADPTPIDKLLAEPKQISYDDTLTTESEGIETLKETADKTIGQEAVNDEGVDTSISESTVDEAKAKPPVEAIKDIEPLDIEPITTDIELLEIFLEEARELDDSINETFSQWASNPEDSESLSVLQRHLHTVKGGARMAGIASIGDLTHEAETIYEMFVNGALTPTQEWVDVMQRVQDVLSQQIDYAVSNHESFYVTALVDQLKQFAKEARLPEKVELAIPNLLTKELEEPQAEITQTDEDSQESDISTIDSKFHSLVVSSWGGSLPDEDILGVFLEEAQEIVDSSSGYLNTFRSNTSDLSVLKKLQRDLHTIKGGARMVPANGIADLAHQMETVYEDLASRRRPATKMVGQLLESCHDWLANAVSLLEYKINPPLPSKLIGALKKFSKNPDSLNNIQVDSLQLYQDLIKEHEASVKSRSEQYSIDEPPPMTGSFDKAQEQSNLSNEMIRISSSLMERMINLSGESAINRARIDMGVTSLTNTIEEMGMTVQRLADQLRRMDIELEAQVLAQIDDDELLDKADFDPLEMDQYSSLNQLSKSLSESASDLLDIKTTMIDKTRDAESLLLQLSRTQAELQDGLMDSRMVPFSRLIPRLQRIVRQTSSELGKSVELKVINADDEMDRTILERITSPLEHMLRNAVDHGIELPKEREALGKPRTGLIELEVLREGSEVVIHLTDDGSGIDVEAVRKKAISQGLIDPNDTSLTDLDVMQYIFNAGLTTTNKVTQISGRGVGMDVVLNEIRQLGGIVSVESSENQGSRFSMRVPLTVAVSDALVVRVADSYYAIPLVQIERVVRINPERLYDYYQSDQNVLEIDGIDYRLRYLGEILRGTELNELAVHTNLSLPVIIVKNQTGQQLAIQVDEVAGSRIEVVVKPLGRQLSHASGISAATIMADGSVMLILDLMALLRNAPARTQLLVEEDKTHSHKRKTILIVDDSVTVRKVTSRLLDRQGYVTQVAKDGIDAIEILQELTPDLMLLDIEMPRMDGFEVATQVRHDSRLKDIPIIMITSRTGDKHRQRALEVGVNEYMGKPFQEARLLQTVESLLGHSVHE